MRLYDNLDYRMPNREPDSNKGTFGKVLNFCGSENYIGAAYLATVSSLKVGAGFSALATTPNVINTVSAMLPEAVYLSREEGLTNLKDFSTILIGCGLGLKPASKELFARVIQELPKDTDKNLVIDADGLNILAMNSYKLPSKTIITPHPMEAARLLGVSLKYVLSNLEDTAKALSTKFACITVLKTHRTIICNKDLEIHINQHGNSALAKSGTGDVLAGIIAGLLAQKMELYEAAKLGVYIHSRTGEIASEELTEYCVMASDIPKLLHKTIKEISL